MIQQESHKSWRLRLRLTRRDVHCCINLRRDRELSTWGNIDVIRFQQLGRNKRSSLTHEAALSADMLLRHQAVPRPLGLNGTWGRNIRGHVTITW